MNLKWQEAGSDSMFCGEALNEVVRRHGPFDDANSEQLEIIRRHLSLDSDLIYNELPSAYRVYRGRSFADTTFQSYRRQLGSNQRDGGLCEEIGPEVFSADSKLVEARMLRKICGDCLAQEACLETVLEESVNAQPSGIVAGLSRAERIALRYKRRREADS